MTAWDILTAGSTAPNNASAWTHLNAQSGSSATVIISGLRSAYITRGLNANISGQVSANLRKQRLTANKLTLLSASIKKNNEASILCR